MVPAFDKVAFELKPGEISDVVTTAVRLPHHQGRRPQAGPRHPVRRSRAVRSTVPRRAEEAAAHRGLHRGTQEEGEDRGPDLNEESCRRRPPRSSAASRRAGDDRPRQRLDAPAHRREDAGLRRRPDHRHDRRRLLRERRVLARRARRSRPASRRWSNTISTTTSRRRMDSSAADRWTSTSIRIAPAPRLYVIGAGHVGQHLGRIAADAGFRLHVVDDREKFANSERFPAAERSWWTTSMSGCTRRASRRPPTWSS